MGLSVKLTQPILTQQLLIARVCDKEPIYKDKTDTAPPSQTFQSSVVKRILT